VAHYRGAPKAIDFAADFATAKQRRRTSKMAENKAPAWKHHLLAKDDEAINSVAISGDGTKVVAGTYFFTAGPAPTPKTVGMFAYDNKGKPLWPAPDTYPATFGITWVAISRDGTWAASGGQISGTSGLINAYDAATGAKALTYNPPVNVNMVTLNSNGSFLVAGADLLYVFARKGSTKVWDAPQTITYPGGKVERVAISDDGKWIVAAVAGGVVSLVRNNGSTLGPPATWSLPNSWILWVSIAANGSGFAVAGSDGNVYYFDINASASSTTPLKPAWQATLTGCSACRSVAVCDDGSRISAVGDFKSSPATGRVFLLANQGTSGKQLWSSTPTTLYGANSTSIDAKAQYVTVTDGTPAGTAGNFYLFDAKTGNLLWSYKTSNMNWPMEISANATGIAAGSDDCDVYYFSVP
jgi:PQQ enzyme repeat